jgi:hypothetical protein
MIYRVGFSAAVQVCPEREEDVEQRFENEIQDYIKNFLKHTLGRDEIGEFTGATVKNQNFTLTWFKETPHYRVFERCLAEFVSCFWEKWEAERQLERAENKYERARHNYKYFTGK